MNKTLNQLIPMLAITGRPDKNRIEEILEEYNRVDINQIMLYPRSGCELEYMSEEWFSVLKCFIEKGKDYNMRFWLYDEMDWPSGSCSGKVTKIPEYRLKALSKKGGKVEIISGSGQWENRICPDVLCPEGVSMFIENTHEKYKKALGGYFGREIIGIFTDEPGYIYESWMLSKDFSESFPYYEGMKEDFALENNGKDLFVEYEKADENSECFFESITNLLKNRFKNVYMKRIGSWCAENGLLFTGHLFNESPLASSVQCNGNIIEQMQCEDLPGMDDIWTRLTLDGVEWDTLSSLKCAIKHNQKGGMAELFALGPCDMGFVEKEKMIALCASHMVDHYFLAVAPVDLRGNAIKNAYFNLFSSIQPWFMGLKELNNFANKAVEFAHSKIFADVEIVYPAKDISKMLGNPERAWKMSGEFSRLLKELVKNQISWDFALENTGSCPFTFEFKNGICHEINSGKFFDNVDDVILWLLKKTNSAIKVTDERGNLLSDVFARCSSWGVLLVDLNKKREKLPIKINCDGKIINTILHGVMIENYENLKDFNVKEIKIFANFEYKPCFLTPYRPFFKNVEKIDFEATEDFECFATIRKYPTVSKIKLNDEIIETSCICNLLPKGMGEFYTQCKIKIKKGKNTICCSEKDEINYLPAVILFGNFKIDKYGILGKQGNMCSDSVFYGSCEFKFNIDVPCCENLFLCCEGNNYYCELFNGTEKLGKTIDNCKSFEIPSHLKGKNIEFTLKYYSSVSSLMGEIHQVLEGYESKPDRISVPSLKWEICG